MSAYPPPQEFNPVFNESEYNTSNDGLTQASGDLRYLKLTGGVLSGLTTFSSGLQTPNIYNSGNTFSVPSASGQLALVSQIPSLAGYVDLTTNQTIAGIKSFSNSIKLKGPSTGLITINNLSTADRDISVPLLSQNDEFVMKNQQQTIQNKNISFLSPVPLLAVVSATTISTTRTHGLDVGDTISFPNLGAITGITANTTYTIDTLPTTSQFTLLGIAGLGGSVNSGSYYIIINHAAANPGVFQMIDGQNTGFPLQFDLSTCTKAPLLRFQNNTTSTPIAFPATGGGLMNNTSATTISGIHTHSAQIIMTRLGQTTAALAPFYYNHSSTAFTGANNYYFVHHGIPPSTGTTTGFGATINIAGQPANSNATTSAALRIETGNFQMLGTGLAQVPNLKVATTGSSIAGIVRGANTITPPGANGPTITITHNLGIAPVFISAIVDKNGQPVVADNFTVSVRSHSTSQVVFEIWRVDVNSGWSGTYQLDWMVMG